MSDPVDFSNDADGVIVNLADVQDTTFEALPKGFYTALITECEFTHSQNSGNPMWSLKYEIDEGEYEGRVLFSHMVFAGNGLAITKRHLSRVAPELLDGPFNPASAEIIESMLNRRVKLRVDIKMYEGQKRNNVKDVLAAPDSAFG